MNWGRQEESVGFDEAIFRCLAKYAVFSGRARLSEFWWFTALYLTALGIALGATALSPDLALPGTVPAALLTPPALAVTVRRLHDIGVNGWTLILLVPVLGQVVLLAWLTRPGIARLNRYGPEPGKSPERMLLYAR